MVNNNEVLKEVVRRLVKELNAKAIILFGSRARGDWLPWSDYDILVIADFKEDYLSRLGKVLEVLSDLPIVVEPHPYTLEEATEMLKKGNPIIVDALEEGIVLHKSEDLDKLMKTYEEMKRKGLRRSEVSIILPPNE